MLHIALGCHEPGTESVVFFLIIVSKWVWGVLSMYISPRQHISFLFSVFSRTWNSVHVTECCFSTVSRPTTLTFLAFMVKYRILTYEGSWKLTSLYAPCWPGQKAQIPEVWVLVSPLQNRISGLTFVLIVQCDPCLFSYLALIVLYGLYIYLKLVWFISK